MQYEDVDGARIDDVDGQPMDDNAQSEGGPNMMDYVQSSTVDERTVEMFDKGFGNKKTTKVIRTTLSGIHAQTHLI